MLSLQLRFQERSFFSLLFFLLDGVRGAGVEAAVGRVSLLSRLLLLLLLLALALLAYVPQRVPRPRRSPRVHHEGEVLFLQGSGLVLDADQLVLFFQLLVGV